MVKINRRNFSKGLVAAGALASVGDIFVNQRLNPMLVEGAANQMGLDEKWVASGCNGCVGWCPLMVRVVNGRAVQITGNSNSVWTKGKTCPRAHLNLQVLYDPDRIKSPLKRTNPNKGRDQDPGWVPITWDEALSTITLKLKELRDKGTPERFALIRGRYDAACADVLYSRFAKAYGTPNSYSHSSLCAESTKGGRWLALGDNDYSGFDWYNANYIISFGSPFLETHRPTTGIVAAWGQVRRGERGRARFVMVDPRCSVTASKADEWVPVNPQTDAALALGMAHEILIAGLWSKSFVGDFDKNSPVKKFEKGKEIADDFTAEIEKEVEDPETREKKKVKETVSGKTFKESMTSGLIKWWNTYLKDFTPQIAAEKTGIPETTIKRLAREFAKSTPSIAIWGRGCDAKPAGSISSYAVISLNALSGSIEKVVNHRPSVSYTAEAIAVEEDDVAKEGRKKSKLDESKTKKFINAGVVTNNVADKILEGKPYPIELALAWWSNFAFSAPSSKRWEEAYKKIPFVIHHTTHISETSVYADILLPAKTYIEKWGFNHPAGTAGLSRGATLFQPVVEPLYDCRSELELALELGERLGNHYPSIKKSFSGLGGAYGDTSEGYVKQRTEKQWTSFSGGWDEFKQKGATNHSYKAKTEFATPSKKFEFYSGVLMALFEKNEMTDQEIEVVIKAKGDTKYVPHYEEPIFIGSKETYPLVLMGYKLGLSQEGRSSNTRLFQMHTFVNYQTGGTNFAEINTKTAEKYGISEGDDIYVESVVGKIKLKAKVTETVHPESVCIAFGQGHFAYGDVAKNRGANPNEITGVGYDHLTGMSAFYNTRVRIYRG